VSGGKSLRLQHQIKSNKQTNKQTNKQIAS
jgi:hypothetical protein